MSVDLVRINMDAADSVWTQYRLKLLLGRANRKILEELEEQKKRLRMQAQGPPQAASASAVPAAPNTVPPSSSTQIGGPETYHMTPSQRAALQHAHANSVGYFITQDSSFGNLILPVLPRLEKPS